MRVSKPLPLTLEVRNLLFMHLWPAVPRLFAYTYTLWCRWVSMLADSEEVHVPMVQACVAHACLFPKGLDDTVNDKWEAANVCMAAVQPHRHAPSYPVKTCADTLRGRLGHRIGLDNVDERGGCVERLQHTPSAHMHSNESRRAPNSTVHG
ncbi:hypothetical protein EDB89DRAFT_2013594 [Lactarius sanguifluus]|nr:hypothetical protein EDB89DRAFT_2013594 [Lactarius sanguifluus]